MEQASTEAGDGDPPPLLVALQDGVLLLTLNRPNQANAIDQAMELALAEVILAARSDSTVQVIVITGAGDRFFCSGMDVKPRANGAAGRPVSGPMEGRERSIFEIILQTYKPTIAAMNGAAAGGGVDLALACDLRVQVAGSYMMLPEVRRGMAAHFSSILLPRAAPSAIAFEMLYLGDKVQAQRAYDVGLVNRLAQPGETLTVAMEMARTIAANAPVSLQRIKETSTKASGLPLFTALHLNEGLSPYDTEDRKEGMRAFIQKRNPVWKGR